MDAFSSPEFVLLEWLSRRPGLFDDDVPSLVDDASELGSCIEKLTRLGYTVEAHPVNGVRLRDRADVVDREVVEDALETENLGRTLVCHLLAGSTNDLAWDLAASGAPSGTTVSAEYQSSGRGRLGRSWFSPVGSGLWVSLLIRPDWPLKMAGLLTLGVGVATAGVIASYGADSGLKWPNDVLIRGRKVAGILTESRTEAGRISVAVIGVGINVHQEEENFPPELRDIATSLCIEGCRVSRSELLAGLLNRVEKVLAQEPEDILRNWEALAPGWGDTVRVEAGEETLHGRMTGLSDSGALILEVPEGGTRTIHAGDVQQLRKG